MEIQVEYLNKSDILVPKLDDAIYIKGTLQIHHLERVGKSKVYFYYNSTCKKSSSLLRAVDYALASNPDSDLDQLDKQVRTKKMSLSQKQLSIWCIGSNYWKHWSSFVWIKKKTIEILGCGSKYSRRLCLCSVFKT